MKMDENRQRPAGKGKDSSGMTLGQFDDASEDEWDPNNEEEEEATKEAVGSHENVMAISTAIPLPTRKSFATTATTKSMDSGGVLTTGSVAAFSKTLKNHRDHLSLAPPNSPPRSVESCNDDDDDDDGDDDEIIVWSANDIVVAPTTNTDTRKTIQVPDTSLSNNSKKGHDEDEMSGEVRNVTSSHQGKRFAAEKQSLLHSLSGISRSSAATLQHSETLLQPRRPLDIHRALANLHVRNLPSYVLPMRRSARPRHQHGSARTNYNRSPYRGVHETGLMWGSNIAFETIKYDLGLYKSDFTAARMYAWAYEVIHGSIPASEILDGPIQQCPIPQTAKKHLAIPPQSDDDDDDDDDDETKKQTPPTAGLPKPHPVSLLGPVKDSLILILPRNHSSSSVSRYYHNNKPGQIPLLLPRPFVSMSHNFTKTTASLKKCRRQEVDESLVHNANKRPGREVVPMEPTELLELDKDHDLEDTAPEPLLAQLPQTRKKLGCIPIADSGSMSTSRRHQVPRTKSRMPNRSELPRPKISRALSSHEIGQDKLLELTLQHLATAGYHNSKRRRMEDQPSAQHATNQSSSIICKSLPRPPTEKTIEMASLRDELKLPTSGKRKVQEVREASVSQSRLKTKSSQLHNPSSSRGPASKGHLEVHQNPESIPSVCSNATVLRPGMRPMFLRDPSEKGGSRDSKSWSLQRSNRKKEQSISPACFRTMLNELNHPSKLLIPNKDEGDLHLPAMDTVLRGRNGALSKDKLTDTDILFGRGAFINGWIGNRWYRGLVCHYRLVYAQLQKFEKVEMARNLVRYIRLLGGRFLEQHKLHDDFGDDTVFYYEAGDERAVVKTSQALREAVPSEFPLFATAYVIPEPENDTLSSVWTENSVPGKRQGISPTVPRRQVPGSSTTAEALVDNNDQSTACRASHYTPTEAARNDKDALDDGDDDNAPRLPGSPVGSCWRWHQTQEPALAERHGLDYGNSENMSGPQVSPAKSRFRIYKEHEQQGPRATLAVRQRSGNDMVDNVSKYSKLAVTASFLF